MTLPSTPPATKIEFPRSRFPEQVRRVGVIGGGQLAWMMASGAKALGIELVVQTPNASDPAVAIAADVILAPITDADATAQLAAQCDLITFENEFINLPALAELAAKGVQFYPQLDVLAPLLDKYDQRCYLNQIGLPTPQFVTLASQADLPSLQHQAQQLGFPLVLKTRRLGYDGQGTFILKAFTQLEATWRRLEYAPVLLEEFVPFERELAVMAARAATGEMVVYPVVETQQVDQVCRRVLAPAPIAPPVAEQVHAIAQTLLNSLEAVGVFGVELFLTPEGRPLVNEIAPRTHNSGHYSLDACDTCQFEQQLRAVCGLPLGSAKMHCRQAIMVNLLGYETRQSSYFEKRQQLAQIPNAHLYWYGKTASRPGRKLGHVTVCLDTTSASPARLATQGRQIAEEIESIWYSSEGPT